MISRSLDLAKGYLGTSVEVKIDRPFGSRHPEHGFVYEADYGFVPGTNAPDGEELDAYVLGIGEPVRRFTGICIAIIHRLDDDDDKLVIVPETLKAMTDDEIRKATYFQEKFFTSEIVRG